MVFFSLIKNKCLWETGFGHHGLVSFFPLPPPHTQCYACEFVKLHGKWELSWKILIQGC